MDGQDRATPPLARDTIHNYSVRAPAPIWGRHIASFQPVAPVASQLPVRTIFGADILQQAPPEGPDRKFTKLQVPVCEPSMNSPPLSYDGENRLRHRRVPPPLRSSRHVSTYMDASAVDASPS